MAVAGEVVVETGRIRRKTTQVDRIGGDVRRTAAEREEIQQKVNLSQKGLVRYRNPFRKEMNEHVYRGVAQPG